MFSNTFGEVKVENGELKLKIYKPDFLHQELEEFVENFEKIYLNIADKFTLIADLTNISLGWTTYSKYNLLIKLFSNNHHVSAEYLIKVVVINNNETLIKVLNWIFYMYGMNHPIEFISSESYNKNELKDDEKISEEEDKKLSDKEETCELNSDDSDPDFRNIDSISSDDFDY